MLLGNIFWMASITNLNCSSGKDLMTIDHCRESASHKVLVLPGRVEILDGSSDVASETI